MVILSNIVGLIRIVEKKIESTIQGFGRGGLGCKV